MPSVGEVTDAGSVPLAGGAVRINGHVSENLVSALGTCIKTDECYQRAQEALAHLVDFF